MKTIDPSNAAVAQADITTQAVQAAQDEAAIKNAAKRQAERQAKFDAWVDPEAMVHRRALNDLKAIESLWALRASGNAVTQTPIPPPEELPKELRGQSPSTIRAMLRGNPDWEKKVKAHQELEASRGGFREKYPELFGIDDAKERKKWDKIEIKPDHMAGPRPFRLGPSENALEACRLIMKAAEPEPKSWWQRALRLK